MRTKGKTSWTCLFLSLWIVFSYINTICFKVGHEIFYSTLTWSGRLGRPKWKIMRAQTAFSTACFACFNNPWGGNGSQIVSWHDTLEPQCNIILVCLYDQVAWFHMLRLVSDANIQNHIPVLCGHTIFGRWSGLSKVKSCVLLMTDHQIAWRRIFLDQKSICLLCLF